MIKPPPEKLGSFYLGARYDLETSKIQDEVINYDARDLTTHAVCVGMTGSGKTGLCVGLLEEAALDKVPAIIIDPKGDMTNLLLQFDDLSPAEFRPWINPDDANRKGLSLDDYTQATAAKWKEGLASWGQTSERIKTLKQTIVYTIYTPGSDAGIPIDILGSLAAPKVAFDSDAEMIRERIQGTVAALLGMVGSEVDPVRSREGILLANIFEHYWRAGNDLDLTKLIKGIQDPPVKKLGVFDVDTFFPEKDRFELAMDFNGLVASPQFSNWLRGDPLDIDKIYFTADGKPRHSIFYIAHLSDSERMFFVTLLLNSLITWMRRQSGTSSLRSILYFDEIFGYFPPTSQPPSKKPLLTILKQARAFGLGAVLVTQNPVDLDYKGLSNAGTWFIGKLQTERDKDRVLDGLRGALATAGANVDFDFNEMISSLSSRVFLLHNVHEDEPMVYHTRWALSYLRGPLTRPQVQELMATKKSQRDSVRSSQASKEEKDVSEVKESVVSDTPPSIDPGVDQHFFAVWKSAVEANRELNNPERLTLQYEPMLLALGKVRFYDAKRQIDEVEQIALLAPPPDDFGRVNWDQSIVLQSDPRSILSAPDHPENVPVKYAAVPETLNSAAELKSVKKEVADFLYQNKSITLLEYPELNAYQSTGEPAEAFRMRLMQLAREERDDEVDQIQDKYETKFERIADRIRREENRLEEKQAELRHRKTAEIVGVAETIFSVFAGRRRRSISAVTTKSRMRRKASQSVQSIEDELQDLQEDYLKLEDELADQIKTIQHKWDSLEEGTKKKKITPRRTDVKVDSVSLVWQPIWVAQDGARTSARK